MFSPKNLSVLCALLWLLTSDGALARQNPDLQECEDVLLDAEEHFNQGRLRNGLTSLQACLEGEPTTTEKVQAYALKARIHLDRGEFDDAVEAVAVLVGLDPEYSLGTEPEFDNLVRAERERRASVRVLSVSKVDEPLREAPATAIVVTAEEIERRGYLDLEELLHDLPGFDISRGNGDVYSNVYMRGYRSDRSDRMLLLIDGVEQNDLHSNAVYLSRQFPLSNVEQVEVVYGPASTIYGANAFTGVISITTKTVANWLPNGGRIAGAVQVGGGSSGTSFFDATVAGQMANHRLRWSLTARRYRSDEPKLSEFDDWDYDPSELDELDYQEVMRLGGALGRSLVAVCELLPSDCQVVREDGQVVAIEPTVDGAETAQELDKLLFAKLQGSSED
jgi:outer membrane receptor for ferrienterochelin and colicins